MVPLRMRETEKERREKEEPKERDTAEEEVCAFKRAFIVERSAFARWKVRPVRSISDGRAAAKVRIARLSGGNEWTVSSIILYELGDALFLSG